MAKQKFVITPYTIYRRGDIFVKCGFDLDDSEGSINSHAVGIRHFDSIIDELSESRRVYTTPATAIQQKTTLEDGSSYWSLVCPWGWFECFLYDKYITHSLYEVSYDYCNPGSGQLDLWVNGKLAEVRTGPSTWATSEPHRAIDEIVIRGRQRNFGLSDPPGRAELDNLCVYRYNQIDCEIATFGSPRTEVAPKMIEIVRGFSRFQTTKYMGTTIDLVLRFNSDASHTDFITNADDVFVVCDNKGIFYRGVIALGECKFVGSGIYEQNVVFRSPNKLGEGWN